MAGRVAGAAAAGVGWGAGAAAVLVAAGALTGGVRPILKGVIRAGLAVRERAQLVAAEGTEIAGDLYHEVLEERAAEREARETTVEARGREVVMFPEGRS